MRTKIISAGCKQTPRNKVVFKKTIKTEKTTTSPFSQETSFTEIVYALDIALQHTSPADGAASDRYSADVEHLGAGLPDIVFPKCAIQ